MAKLRDITQDTHEGEEGFIAVYSDESVSLGKTRIAVLQSVSRRFSVNPSKLEVIDITEGGEDSIGRTEYTLMVFIPEKEMEKAGIREPIQFLKEKFVQFRD